MTTESSPIPRDPQPGLDAIRDSLRQAFGIEGELAPLDGEVDINLRVEDPRGPLMVKVSPPSDAGEATEFQQALLKHAHALDGALRVPRPVATLTGEGSASLTVAGHTWTLRVFTFIHGQPLRECDRSPALLEAVGEFLGRLTRALQGFGHPGAHRVDYLWNLDNAEACFGLASHIADAGTRGRVEHVFGRWRQSVKPALPALPAAVVHHDANDDNLLVATADAQPYIGLVDFGDALFARRVNELAVTLAYALMDVSDIAGAARAVIRGYTRAFPLGEDELAVLFDLVATRLAMSLCIAARRQRSAPDHDYLQVSRQQAAALLARLEAVGPAFFHCLARAAAGYAPVASGDAVVSWLTRHTEGFASVFPFDLKTTPRRVVTLARDAPGTEYASDPLAYQRWLDDYLRATGAQYAIGLYRERREVYTTGQFESAASDQRRCVHLGIDLFVDDGTPLHAPLPGRVFSVQDNNLPLDYGATIILEHRCGHDGPTFWTLYGHLARRSLDTVAPGQRVAAGQEIGAIGDHRENGGWTPHLHFQLITDLLGENGNFNGAGEPDNMDVWGAVSPDPNLILGLAPESFDTRAPDDDALRAQRAQSLGPSLSLSYRHQLHIVRGRGAWLCDTGGRAYLDCVNNICHVGHSHPRVVEALHRQAAKLNTNTRYLHRNIIEYAERLLASFPDRLSVCYFVCSGSEANELALRLARQYTRRRDLLVLDWAYHGNTGGLIEISPYKFKRAGGTGCPEHVHIAELPDPFRGAHQGHDEAAALEYVRDVERSISACRDHSGAGPAAMIAESIPGCGGQILFPRRYLRHAFERVREAGGVAIADEVQTGFGRVGDAAWAFELQEAVPDIVTLGKPIGNGHPLAAVVTTREIADAFANGMEYFNSFGGNPVSCAVGLSVLDVIEAEGLRERARDTGADLLARLRDMARRHSLIGDVRGRGLFIGVELVQNRDSLKPATDAANRVINLLREDGVLLSTDGPHDNVLKIKPPLAFGAAEAEFFSDRLDAALTRAAEPDA